eukprot:CAMPEP_0172655436 /NCGR_PEP_ID=MMETSP1074-20121228/647_1 /TAXON_ID=2916 /ORGANISM="Ceratium fusus, Strain PA161109" /LENGTH=66 /DNA_ID=CAMNT_0013470057 /DNA_START=12 /DNA_END=212 /DNA_ORIENTATION=-
MCTANFAPHHTVLGIPDFLLCFVHVCDALANVEAGILFGAYALNLDQRGGRIAIALAPFIAEKDAS